MILDNPDNIIPKLSYRTRKILFDISMFAFRAESMTKRNWGYVQVWKNENGWQERKISRVVIRPLQQLKLVDLVHSREKGSILRTTPLGLLVVRRLTELKNKGNKQYPALRLSDETGQYLMPL